MKERPMIFNAEMVRAILDGRKTQTRRPIRWKQTRATEIAERDDGTLWPWAEDCENGSDIWYPCPFGDVGDRIWARETWGVVSHELDEDGRIQQWAPDRPATAIHEMPFGNGYYSGHAIYAADGEFTWGDDDGYEDGRSCWKPSIHMPRAASRILLEITGVRVERLNDISEADARAEGVTAGVCPGYEQVMHRVAFRELWQSLYGAENWQANPWVWAISFRRVE